MGWRRVAIRPLGDAAVHPGDGLTLRAVGAGLAVGALLCATSLFLGLKTGISDSGDLTASILGFAIGRTILRGRTLYSEHENQVSHTIGAMMSNAPVTMGLLVTLPGLTLLGHHWPWWGGITWGLVLATAGILLAFALRTRLLDDEQLPFPTGVAAANVIRAMHERCSAGLLRARWLFAAAVCSGVAVWLRDLPPRWLPPATFLPGFVRGRSAESLMLGVAWNPMLLGAGALVGLPVAASVLVGGIIGWVAIAPSVTPAAATYVSIASWLALPATALLAAGSLPALTAPLVARWRRRSSHSPGGARVKLLILAVATLLLAVPFGWWLFRWPMAVALAAAVLTLPMAAFCARATGQTDVAPYGVLGQVTQGLLGGLSSASSPAPFVGAASIVGGVATQTSSSLWALKAGSLLGTPLRAQARAQAIGVVGGLLLAMPLYWLLVRAYGIGNEALPALGAQTTRAVAEMIQGGSAIPPGALRAGLVALAVGTMLAFTRLRRVLSPVGLGIGFLLPLSFAVTLFAGALVALLISRRLGVRSQDLVEPAACGLILGETVVGLVAAALTVAGIVR
jgi:uncharacterized oligopeptide transporter (OPT) family protein